MHQRKPRMLIAEDSDIAGQLAALFDDDFDVTVVRDGRSAFAALAGTEAYDVALVDIIMPVENGELPLDAADETGVRLVEEMLARRKCGRFLILTVRWDIESKIAATVGNMAHYGVLLKQQADGQRITEAVAKLLQLDVPEPPDADGILEAISEVYEAVQTVLGRGELYKDEQTAALQSLRAVLGGPALNVALRLKNHPQSVVLGQIRSTLEYRAEDYGDPNVRDLIDTVQTQVDDFIVRHRLY